MSDGEIEADRARFKAACERHAKVRRQLFLCLLAVSIAWGANAALFAVRIYEHAGACRIAASAFWLAVTSGAVGVVLWARGRAAAVPPPGAVL